MYDLKIQLSNSYVNNKMEMKNISLINALQDIEGLHIDDLKEFSKYLNDNNLGVFLLYRQIDIIKRPKFKSTIRLTTYPYKTTPVSGYRHIYVYDEDNSLIIKTNSYGAFVDLDTYIPTRIPKEIIKTIKDMQQSTLMDCLPRKIEYNIEDEIFIEKFKIRKSHIDRYNHVNNAYYIEFALDSFNEEINFNRIRVEYKNSFKLDETVNVYHTFNKNNENVVVLKHNNDEISAVIEFSNATLDI